MEGDSLGCDDVHQRTALLSGEDAAVDRCTELGLREDQAGTRAAQRLMRGAGHDVCVRYGRGMCAARHEPGEVSFIVLLENGAAMAGILVAAAGLALSQFTGNPFFDGAASVVIGLLLGVTAWVLAIESKALLIGELADPELVEGIRAAAETMPGIVGVGHVLTVHSAPDQVTVVMSADFEDSLTAGDVERIVAEIEAKVAAHWPTVKRLYIRPEQDAARVRRKPPVDNSDA